MKTLALFALLLAGSLTTLTAQTPPDRDALLKGDETSQAAYAEESGYPSPKLALNAAVELELTSVQKKDIQKIYDELIERARQLGKQIVRIEEEMRNAFRDGLVTEKSVTADVQEIAKLRGRLRTVYLVAHLKTRSELTREQVRIYMKIKPGTSKG